MIPSNNYIEFKRKREIGTIITDTFKFLRQNFKIIFKILGKTAGIPFVLFIIAQIYYTSVSFSAVFLGSDNPFKIFETSSIFISASLMFLSLFVYFSLLFTSVSCTIKSYITNKGLIKEQEVIDDIRSKIGITLLTGFTKTLILGLAFIICFFPVIYFSVPLYLLFAVFIFENKNVSDSISRTFEIIKEEWWMTFITMLVIGLLWYVASFVLSLPSAIYVWIKTFTSMQEISYTDPESAFDTVSIILTTVATSIQYILYVVVPIGASFVYYNLNERKHQTGTLERINSIGVDEDHDDDTNDNYNAL